VLQIIDLVKVNLDCVLFLPFENKKFANYQSLQTDKSEEVKLVDFDIRRLISLVQVYPAQFL